MAASSSPDITDVSSLYGTTIGFALTTTVTTDLITVSTDKIVKINTMMVSNIDGSNSADVTIALVLADADPNGITDFDVTSGQPWYLAKTVAVPADSTLIVLDTPLFLRAGDVLEGGASANSDLQLVVSYEVYDDA